MQSRSQDGAEAAEFIELFGEPLKLSSIVAVAYDHAGVYLHPRAHSAIEESRRLIERLVEENQVVYGVNTGFGKLSDVSIPAGALRSLQTNLVRTHACGLGKPLSEPEVRATLLLRANVLARGHSGVRRAESSGVRAP